MRVCDGITYMVIGEAPDLSSVDDEVRQHWNSLSIETARREAQRQRTHPLVRRRLKFPKDVSFLILIETFHRYQLFDFDRDLPPLVSFLILIETFHR